MTVNGHEVYYVSSVARELWAYPEFQIDFIKNLKRKCIDQATRGMEPIVEVFDDMPPGLGWGGIPPDVADGSSVEIGVSGARKAH
jgi:hypothetical protein